jgi:hypothetical protein
MGVIDRHRRLLGLVPVVVTLLLAPLLMPVAAHADGQRMELRVLVVVDGSPTVEALRTVAQLTAAALGGDFGNARGPVPFSETDLAPDPSWVEITRPLAGLRTLLTATSPNGRHRGSVAGVFSTDGREELVLAFSYDVDSTQLQVLAPGLVDWVTRGVHLGLDRSYLAVHVDDVLLPNVRWVPGVHCSPAPTARSASRHRR